MGTKPDAKWRECTREDTARREEKVDLTRKWIYEHGIDVNSTYLERVLKPNSWVPSSYEGKFFFVLTRNNQFTVGRMHFRLNLLKSASICIQRSSPTFFMSWNSESGKPSSHI